MANWSKSWDRLLAASAQLRRADLSERRSQTESPTAPVLDNEPEDKPNRKQRRKKRAVRRSKK